MENFHSFIRALLSEPAERELFFKVRTFLSCRGFLNRFVSLLFDFGIGVRTIKLDSSVWQEEFLVEYGPKFDQELEKLLWEFLLRLDRLLPVPNLAQVVEDFNQLPVHEISFFWTNWNQIEGSLLY